MKSFYFYLPSPIVSLKKKAGQQIRCLVCLRFCLKFVYTFHSTRTNRSSLKINKWVFDMIEWFSFIAIISFRIFSVFLGIWKANGDFDILETIYFMGLTIAKICFELFLSTKVWFLSVVSGWPYVNDTVRVT